MNTPTPRTDAATYPADCLGTTLVTNRDCARALEREHATIRAERDQLLAFVNDPHALHAHCLRALNETQIAHLFGQHMTIICNERDELRAELTAERAHRNELSTLIKRLVREARRARPSDPLSFIAWTTLCATSFTVSRCAP